MEWDRKGPTEIHMHHSFSIQRCFYKTAHRRYTGSLSSSLITLTGLLLSLSSYVLGNITPLFGIQTHVHYTLLLQIHMGPWHLLHTNSQTVVMFVNYKLLFFFSFAQMTITINTSTIKATSHTQMAILHIKMITRNRSRTSNKDKKYNPKSEKCCWTEWKKITS